MKKIVISSLKFSGYIVANIMCIYLCFIFKCNVFDFVIKTLVTNALVFICYKDIREKIIPNEILILLCILRIVIILVNMLLNVSDGVSLLIGSVIRAIISGFLFLVISLVIKDSVGMGDVKLVAVLGLYLGLDELFSCLLIALMGALIVSLVLIFMKKMNRKSTLAFAPFLAIGYVMVVLFRV